MAVLAGDDMGGFVSLYQLAGKQPQLLGEGHFIAPGAALIGDVTLGDAVSIWFNAVLRADNEPIVIGAGSNVQDGAVLHVDPGFPLTVAANVVIGHQAMLHGCTVGEHSLIGIGAVVLNGAVIGENCLVGANALVTEGMQVPAGSLVLGSPARVKRALSTDEIAVLQQGAGNYRRKAARYREHLFCLTEEAND
ncbi:MAG TPA: gamma carbonic anhydrase family protein [Pseudomonadales bacterium]